MKSVHPSLVKATANVPTGFTGFDEITGGGLPLTRTSLRVSGPGSGKTVFVLRFRGSA